jgi:hypothetical protein
MVSVTDPYGHILGFLDRVLNFCLEKNCLWVKILIWLLRNVYVHSTETENVQFNCDNNRINAATRLKLSTQINCKDTHKVRTTAKLSSLSATNLTQIDLILCPYITYRLITKLYNYYRPIFLASLTVCLQIETSEGKYPNYSKLRTLPDRVQYSLSPLSGQFPFSPCPTSATIHSRAVSVPLFPCSHYENVTGTTTVACAAERNSSVAGRVSFPHTNSGDREDTKVSNRFQAASVI